MRATMQLLEQASAEGKLSKFKLAMVAGLHAGPIAFIVGLSIYRFRTGQELISGSLLFPALTGLIWAVPVFSVMYLLVHITGLHTKATFVGALVGGSAFVVQVIGSTALGLPTGPITITTYFPAAIIAGALGGAMYSYLWETFYREESSSSAQVFGTTSQADQLIR